MALIPSHTALLLPFLLLLPPALPHEALRCQESQVLLVPEGEPVSMACPFHEHCHKDAFHEIIWSYENDTRRILQFRKTPPVNTSVVSCKEGHFGGELDFGRCVSFLNISEVLLNDTGRYLCYVKVGHGNSSMEVTHLLVRGQPPSAASKGLLLSAPEGSEVTLDCDLGTNGSGSFAELLWLHWPEEGPARLLAWHHECSCPGGVSAGRRVSSVVDPERRRGRLTMAGLQKGDSGWYQCEGLGQVSGRHRGRATRLTVKGSLTVLLVALGSAGLALAASCLYFQCCSRRAGRPACSRAAAPPEPPRPRCERAAEPATYASLSCEYSLLTLSGRSASPGSQGHG